MISVILSGGVGSRLWPVSRTKLPKQFCDIFSETLFSKTINRFQTETIVISNIEHKTYVDIEIKNKKVIKTFFEPVGKNTAPAVALACSYLKYLGKENEVCGIFPSDHWIEDEEKFIQTVFFAEEVARLNQIVTLGIMPAYPATGYGYIELTDEVINKKQDIAAYRAKKFHEKPKQEIAKKYLESKNYVWNSGIFIFQVKTMIEALKEQAPEVWRSFESFDFLKGNLVDLYSSLPSISIDYAVMEKINNHASIPSYFGWSDLGSWDDISHYSSSKNANVHEYNSKNNFILTTENKITALVGVDDLNIIETHDAILIQKKGTGQDVRNIVELIGKKNPKVITEHIFEQRPWGNFRSIAEENSFKSKIICVDPGQQLSYQSHQKREEVWIVVEGEGEVTIDDIAQNVTCGSVVRIPKKSKHRIKNSGTKNLKFVEVQLGEYFGEDDIIRYSDDYGRVK